jgi:hypothetical protein
MDRQLYQWINATQAQLACRETPDPVGPGNAAYMASLERAMDAARKDPRRLMETAELETIVHHAALIREQVNLPEKIARRDAFEHSTLSEARRALETAESQSWPGSELARAAEQSVRDAERGWISLDDEVFAAEKAIEQAEKAAERAQRELDRRESLEVNDEQIEAQAAARVRSEIDLPIDPQEDETQAYEDEESLFEEAEVEEPEL